MNKDKALNLLRAYRDEVEAIRKRLIAADAASPFSDEDDKRYHQIGLQLKDFTADNLMDNRRTSFQLVRQFTQSMSFTSGKPTAKGVESYRETLDELIARIEQTPFILRKTPDAEEEPTKPAAQAASAGHHSEQFQEGRTDPLELIAKRFHLVERQLREFAVQTSGEVEFEQRTQNVLHSLLLLHFEHVEREQWTPPYADDGVAVSYYLPDVRTMAEIRKPSASLSADALKEQLSHHIKKHQSHPECDRVFCLVYDPIGRISDPRGLESALSVDGEKRISVKIIPRE